MAGSRSQRDNRSGLGFPIKILRVSTKRNVVASPRPRLIQAVFHSQSLYLHVFGAKVPLAVETLGVKTNAITAVRIPGIIVEISTSRVVDTFSCSVNGNDISGSTGEKGRRLGLVLQGMVPIAAIPLGIWSAWGLLDQLQYAHDSYPI